MSAVFAPGHMTWVNVAVAVLCSTCSRTRILEQEIARSGCADVRAPRDKSKQAFLTYVAHICSGNYVTFSMARHADLAALLLYWARTAQQYSIIDVIVRIVLVSLLICQRFLKFRPELYVLAPRRCCCFCAANSVSYKGSGPRAAEAARYARARKNTTTVNVKGAERRGP